MRHVAILLTMLLTTASASAQQWLDQIASMPIQKLGRTMPVDTFAKELAVQLTGRSKWSAKRGPEAFADRHRVELLCDLLFAPDQVRTKPLVAIENRPFKRTLGLDDSRKFFSFDELAGAPALSRIMSEYSEARRQNEDVQPTPEQRRAIAVSNALDAIFLYLDGQRLAIVPSHL